MESDHTESQNGEVIEEVRAEHVTISQGGANHVEAVSVEVNQGGIQALEAESVSISQGGALMVDAADAHFTMSGAGLLTGDTVHLKSGGAGAVVADTVHAEPGSMIGVLFAGTIEGTPDVKVDARTAAALGAGFAVTLFVLRRLFKRRS